jgi:type I restriction enzyme, S subunit
VEVKRGYKQTEVGLIPEDWQTRPCSALSDLITVGIVVRPAQYYTTNGVPALRSANIREDGINDQDMVFISEQSNALLSKSQVRTGDVLTVRTGYPGTSAVVPPNFAGSNCIDILITRPSNSTSSEFLSAWINSSIGKSQVLRNQGGLAQQHFNVTDLRNLIVALPPTKVEQEAIAEALSDADALIESLEQLLAKKRQLKQGAMQELLTGKKRLPGFSGEWEERPLEAEIAGLEAGVSVNSAEGEGDPGSGDAAILKTSCVDRGTFVPTECKRILARDIVRAKLTPQFDAILISRMNTIDLVGECGYVALDYPQLFVPDRLWMTRFRKDAAVSAKWLSYVLSSDAYRSSLKGLAAGTSGSMKNIAKRSFLSLRISFPSVSEQNAIATILSDMDTETTALEAKLAKNRQIKQGMMQELLTGKIRLV